MRRSLLAAPVLAVAVATSTWAHSPTPGTASARTEHSSSPATPTSSPSQIAVKDAYTAVLVTVLSPPTAPVAGTDGRYHVGYNLMLQNASRISATLDKVEVVDAAEQSTVVAAFAGTQLVDPTCDFGDCNRLRTLAGATATDAVIPPEEARQLIVDYAFDSLADVPATVMHRLTLHGAASPVTADPVPLDYTVAPHDLSVPAPVRIGPPVKGKNWVAINGCCEPGWPHFGSSLAANGSLFTSQTFAIDWKRANRRGEFYTGDKTRNESYVDYGSDIIAVADGTVTATLDGLEANKPGVLPATDPVLGPQLTVENVDGNHVVLDIGNGNYAFYAHMMKGSLRVEVGDRVTKGQVLGKLGNTGNANASHMHFHLMNGPSVLGSSGVPYVIDSFRYRGKVSAQQFWDADNYLTGDFFGAGHLRRGRHRSNQLPLAWTIVDFPR
jgi:hypothetical protein